MTLIKKKIVLAKRRVEWLEEQNEAFTKIAEKQQVELVDWKNPITVVRLRGGPKESWCGSWRVGYAREGNEGAKGEDEAHRLLPLSNRRVRHFEDGTCIYESWTFNLLVEAQEEQVEYLELYKEQIGEIIWEAFKSYLKDKELYWLCIETYQHVIPHLRMSPFKLSRTQTHSRFASEFGLAFESSS